MKIDVAREEDARVNLPMHIQVELLEKVLCAANIESDDVELSCYIEKSRWKSVKVN